MKKRHRHNVTRWMNNKDGHLGGVRISFSQYSRFYISRSLFFLAVGEAIYFFIFCFLKISLFPLAIYLPQEKKKSIYYLDRAPTKQSTKAEGQGPMNKVEDL